MKKRSTKLKWIGATLAGLGALAVSSGAMANKHEHHAEPHGMKAESDGGLMVFSPSDSTYWFELGGRLAFDETQFAGGYQDKNGDFPSGGNIRYARLKFAGGVGEYLTYNLTLNFNESSTRGQNATNVDFEDAWLAACSEYSGAIDRASIRFGQYTPPTSIDDWGNYGTVNDNFFLESSLATKAFARPTKVIGLWVDATAFDMFALSMSAHQPRQNNTGIANNTDSANNYLNPGRSDRLGGNVRLTFAPVHTEDTVYHLGVIGRYQSMNNVVSGAPVYQANFFSVAPEARARNTNQVVNTGNIRARSFNVVTGEALAMWGPAWIEGEYSQANVQRVPTITVANSGNNPEFNSWHIQGGYVITGESRVYDFVSGTLRNPKPADRCGAWEVLARFSYVNLVDRNIYGGSEHNASLGLNWFVNENVRIAANYIRANIRATSSTTPGTAPAGPPTLPTKRQLDIFGLRFGVEF